MKFNLQMENGLLSSVRPSLSLSLSYLTNTTYAITLLGQGDADISDEAAQEKRRAVEALEARRDALVETRDRLEQNLTVLINLVLSESLFIDVCSLTHSLATHVCIYR